MEFDVKADFTEFPSATVQLFLLLKECKYDNSLPNQFAHLGIPLGDRGDRLSFLMTAHNFSRGMNVLKFLNPQGEEPENVERRF
jgi:hypothetical protein